MKVTFELLKVKGKWTIKLDGHTAKNTIESICVGQLLSWLVQYEEHMNYMFNLAEAMIKEANKQGGGE